VQGAVTGCITIAGVEIGGYSLQGYKLIGVTRIDSWWQGQAKHVRSAVLASILATLHADILEFQVEFGVLALRWV
jgi:hypothetical protein